MKYKHATCTMKPSRPGIIQSFLQPVKLKDQVDVNAPETELKFKPLGKNLVGGTQWTIKVMRPGIAQPLIISKKETKALTAMANAQNNGLPKAKALAKAKAKAKAKAMAAEGLVSKPAPEEKILAKTLAAEAKAKAKAKALNGWFF